MRSYGQYCALARSLDVLGDRWTLLIIRELFARDSRYSDLRDGLPGIATNLLADRLRQLQADGVVESYEAPPPVRATVYRLTPRGRELGPVLRSLVQWGRPLLATEQGEDAFRPQWLKLALRILYDDVDVNGIGPLTFVVANEHEPVTVEIDDDVAEVRLGRPSETPMIELEGKPHDVYALLAGTTGSDPVLDVRVEGSDGAVDRLHTLIRRVRAAQITASTQPTSPTSQELSG